jgi:hypothetical protein
MNSVNYFRIALLTQGVILIGMGCYFVFFRPALLPEDLSYIGTSEAEIGRLIPGLAVWLKKVFIVLGGYVFTSGLLMSYPGIGNNQTKGPSLLIVISLTGLSSIVMMTVVNFIIDSDFKWLLLLFTTPWIFSLFNYFRSVSAKGSYQDV